MTTKEPVLSVGELSARSGVAVSALHFFRRQGFIESERTAEISGVTGATCCAGWRSSHLRNDLGTCALQNPSDALSGEGAGPRRWIDADAEEGADAAAEN